MTEKHRNIQSIDIERIHPDPLQPRLVVGDELAASIKEQGVLQVISVEPAQPLESICSHCDQPFALLAELGDWMINDGERRWTGARAAGLEVIDAEILPPSSPADRLIRQLTANTGLPLTPVEEAFAFNELLTNNGWSQNQLAKNLGRPRSVIGDRIRLVSLHPVWLELITSAKLQVSHAPILSIFSDVPADYQVKAANALVTDYRAKKYIDEGDAIPVDEFKHLVYVAFRDYIKPIGDVRGYKGPVFSFKRDSYRGEEKFAADINLWRPIWREVEKKRRKARESGSSSRAPREVVRWIDKLGDDIPTRQSTEYHVEAKAGEEIVYREGYQWGHDVDLVPEAFLSNVDRTKLVRVYARHSFGVVTSDGNALKLARQAFDAKLDKLHDIDVPRLKKEFASEEIRAKYSITGPGTLALLLDYFEKEPASVRLIARAIGAEIHSDAGRMALLQQAVIERLASAIVAVSVDAVELPDIEVVAGRLSRKLQHSPFVLPNVDAKKKAEKTAKKEKGAALGKQIAIERKSGARAEAHPERSVPVATAEGAADVDVAAPTIESATPAPELAEATA